MTAICSVAEGISAYFFIYQKRCWDLAYLCTALALAIILLLRQAIKISRRIMEAENCYMALEEDSLAVCQPEKNGKRRTPLPDDARSESKIPLLRL